MPDEFAAWEQTGYDQEFFEHCVRSDFLSWLDLMRNQAKEAQDSLRQPDGKDLLTNKFIIKSGGEETGFSFSHQRLRVVPKNRHRSTSFREAVIRLPDNSSNIDAPIDCAFVSILGEDNDQMNYFIDKKTFVKLDKLEDGSYEEAEEASSTDYEDLRIILANFEVGLQDNSPGSSSGNAA